MHIITGAACFDLLSNYFEIHTTCRKTVLHIKRVIYFSVELLLGIVSRRCIFIECSNCVQCKPGVSNPRCASLCYAAGAVLLALAL
jgi:hypothetical protein